jgi:HEAT repeat protein
MPCVSLAADLGDRKLVPLLAPVATDPFGDAALREEARKALAAMKDDLDAPRLAEAARGARSAGERAQALAMLSIAGGERAYVALTRALADPEELVRARAAFCLGEFGDRRAVKALAAAVDDPRNARVRKVVQGALDKLLAQ